MMRIDSLVYSDDPSGRRSTFSDAGERFDLTLSSTMTNDPDLNDSISSKSNPGDSIDVSNLDTSHPTATVRSTVATPAVLTNNNTSGTSTTSYPGQSTARALSGRLTSIMERRSSPDALLKKWIKAQKLTTNNPEEPLPLTVNSSSLFHQ